MSDADADAACPCGSGDRYSGCCGPVHDGDAAPTAEALMRSRFSAFVLGLEDHVLATWHPDTRPDTVGLDPALHWRRLQIVDTVAGSPSDAEGVVEFRASFRHPAGTGLLHERSRFTRIDGRWFYVDGDEVPEGGHHPFTFVRDRDEGSRHVDRGGTP